MDLSNSGSILCCGNIVFDISVWPVDDTDWQWSTTRWVESITESIGGNGANTAYTLAVLGTPVRLTSLVGDDERGDRALSRLSRAGVDVSKVGRATDLPTPATIVLTHREGNRKFLHRPGASQEFAAESVAFDGCSHFHFANPFALPRARTIGGSLMQRAKAAGLTTSVDTGWDANGRWMQDLGSYLPHTDILFVNDAEVRALTGQNDLDTAVAAIRQAGVNKVVVKTGPEGCLLYADRRIAVPGFKVDAIDTTGAGDCFSGAFLTALYRGLPWEDSARVANAVGAMNVEKLGASTGVRSWSETIRWMKTHGDGAVPL